MFSIIKDHYQAGTNELGAPFIVERYRIVCTYTNGQRFVYREYWPCCTVSYNSFGHESFSNNSKQAKAGALATLKQIAANNFDILSDKFNWTEIAPLAGSEEAMRIDSLLHYSNM